MTTTPKRGWLIFFATLTVLFALSAYSQGDGPPEGMVLVTDIPSVGLFWSMAQNVPPYGGMFHWSLHCSNPSAAVPENRACCLKPPAFMAVAFGGVCLAGEFEFQFERVGECHECGHAMRIFQSSNGFAAFKRECLLSVG
jgi:hypothetical protein